MRKSFHFEKFTMTTVAHANVSEDFRLISSTFFIAAFSSLPPLFIAVVIVVIIASE